MRPRLFFLAGMILTLLAVAFWVASRLHRKAEVERGGLSSTAPWLELHVPHVHGEMKIDGETEEAAWQTAVTRTGAFVDPAGKAAHPYSDARLTWDETNLYLLLYAADEDLEAHHEGRDAALWLEDDFHVFLGDGREEWTLDVSPRGSLTDGRRRAQSGNVDGGARPFDYGWSSDAQVGVDLDGTLNDPSDDDEEWVVEMAIPLRSIGLTGRAGERLAFHVHRCDTPKGGPRSCASWGEGERDGLLVLEP